MAEIEFYYDVGSPNAYLAHEGLKPLAARHGATLAYRPILLGGVFQATDNQSPMQSFAGVRGKLDYQRREMARFCERHGVAFQMNPAFPINTLALMRAAVFASGKPWEQDLVEALFAGMWVTGRDMGDVAIVQQVLDHAGLPGADILSATALPDVKGKLIAATQEAVARGIYGAPTMFLDGEMFFGKDALSDLDWRLGQPADA